MPPRGEAKPIREPATTAPMQTWTSLIAGARSQTAIHCRVCRNEPLIISGDKSAKHLITLRVPSLSCPKPLAITNYIPVAPFAPIEFPGFEVDHRPDDREQTTKLNTLFLLMAQYDGRVIVPAEIVCKDYFSHLTITKFQRKVSTGEIDLPLTRAERS